MFLIILFGLTMILHTIVWISYRYFFSVSWRRSRVIFFLIPILLTLSFLLLHSLVEDYDVDFFYQLSGIWVGMFVYIFFSSLIFLLIWGISFLVRKPLSVSMRRVIGRVGIGVVILFSGYSVWNAFDIDVVKHDLFLPSFPSSWEGRVIVHITDTHLGGVFHEDHLETILSVIQEQNPYAVFITGDVFDGASHDMRDLVAPLRSFQVEGGVYVVSGNHERYAGYEDSRDALVPGEPIFMDDRVVTLDGVAIGGLSYPSDGSQDRDVESVFGGNVSSEDPFIVLFHAPYKSVLEKIASFGSDLVLLGHTHRGQLYPFNYITHLVYNGLDYGLHSFADGYLYTSSGVGGWGPPFRSGSDAEVVVFSIQTQ